MWKYLFKFRFLLLGTSTISWLSSNCWSAGRRDTVKEQIHANCEDHAIDILQSNFINDRLRCNWRSSISKWTSNNHIRSVRRFFFGTWERWSTYKFKKNKNIFRRPKGVWKFLLCNGIVFVGTSNAWKSSGATRSWILDSWRINPSKIVSLTTEMWNPFC